MNSKIKLLLEQAIHAFYSNDLKQAEKLLKQCLHLDAKNFDALHLLAIVYASLGNHKMAIEYFQEALKLCPNDASALSNYGSSLNSIGKNQEALSAFQKAIHIIPDASEFWYNAGNTLCDLNKYEEALTYYEKAIQLNPKCYEFYNNYGKTLYELKRYSESLIYYDQALKGNPFFLECLVNKGVALDQLKRFDEALDCHDQVLNLEPNYAQVWSNKGTTLIELKRYDEALIHLDKALSLKPDYAEAWAGKGFVFNELKRHEEAIHFYDKALALKPGYAEAWYNKGSTLHVLKRYTEAIIHYDEALKLKPDIDWVLGELLHLKMKMGSWSSLLDTVNTINHKVMVNQKVIQPHTLLSIGDDPLLHQKNSKIFVGAKFPQNLSLGRISKFPKRDKIRIAYFSPDFKKHPVAFLTAELFEIHDRDRFEVFAFSLQKAPIQDEMSARLRKGFDTFLDVENMSDLEIAQLARKLEIDIAIDLAGHTQYSGTRIFSYRAAPIQVNWLGYPGTSGADYFDYIVADEIIIPNKHHDFYTEKVAYLPDTYMVDDSRRIASSRVFTREELGLPKSSFVFCCFNNDYKFNPRVIDSWSKILLSVEHSVLWISENNEHFRENLIKEFNRRGVHSDRIIFAKRLELMGDHLARYCLADIFLDTYPYNAHTTAMESLKAGLPVLTLIGESFASRVAASLLNAIGLPELITHSQQEYECLAIELALNPQKLADIKDKLANRRSTAPLFDTKRFTKNLEAVYLTMYERHQIGLEPAHISIT